eukprot:scaffold258651_cov43-Attheya_sp.AAC.1
MASATMSSPSSYNDDEEGPDDERLPQSQSQSQSQPQQTSQNHPPDEKVVEVVDPEESKSATTNSVGPSPSPTTAKRTEMCEAQMVLLCLDYLRDLRRTLTHAEVNEEKEDGMAGDYISIAIWALSRSFPQSHAHLCQDNDPWFRPKHNPKQHPPESQSFALSPEISIPDVQEINREIIVQEGMEHEEDNDYEDPPYYGYRYNNSEYEYEDLHASNGDRFYPLGGLAAGPPLTLVEIAMAGVTSLQSRSRGAVEQEMIHHNNPLFTQFVSAVRARGFFDNNENENNEDETGNDNDTNITQDKRYAKVVAKFRTKLATKAAADEQQKQQQQQLLALRATTTTTPNHLSHGSSSSSSRGRDGIGDTTKTSLTNTAAAATLPTGRSMMGPRDRSNPNRTLKPTTISNNNSNNNKDIMDDSSTTIEKNNSLSPPNIDIGPAHDRHLRRRRTQRLESIRKGKPQNRLVSPSSTSSSTITPLPPHVPESCLLSMPLSPPPPPAVTAAAATTTLQRNHTSPPRKNDDDESKPKDSPSTGSPSLSVKSSAFQKPSSVYSSRRRDGEGGSIVNNNNDNEDDDTVSRRLGGYDGTLLTSRAHTNGNDGGNPAMAVAHNNSEGNAAKEAERLKNVGNA